MSRYLAWGAAGLLAVGAVRSPSAAFAGGGWVVYWDGSYHGQVLDAETKAPLEGVVVVAVYHESCYRFIQTNSKEIGVQEVLTDTTGKFRVPSFWTVSTPDCWYESTGFFVFKPGYATFPTKSLIGETVPSSTRLDMRTKVYSPDHPNLEFVQDIFKAGVIVELPRLESDELQRYLISAPVTSDRLTKRLKKYHVLEAEYEKMLVTKP